MKNIKNKISIKQILFLMFVVGFQQDSLGKNGLCPKGMITQNYKDEKIIYLNSAIDGLQNMIESGCTHDDVIRELEHMRHARRVILRQPVGLLVKASKIKKISHFVETMHARHQLLMTAGTRYRQYHKKFCFAGIIGLNALFLASIILFDYKIPVLSSGVLSLGCDVFGYTIGTKIANNRFLRTVGTIIPPDLTYQPFNLD